MTEKQRLARLKVLDRRLRELCFGYLAAPSLTNQVRRNQVQDEINRLAAAGRS